MEKWFVGLLYAVEKSRKAERSIDLGCGRTGDGAERDVKEMGEVEGE